jgi:hypothetical protein
MRRWKKVSKGLIKRARAQALTLLESQFFFNRLLAALDKDGFVGEEQAKLAIYIVATSRFFRRPLNVILKGPSSVGKNFAASHVLRLIPPKDVKEISSTSERAWSYAEEDLCRKIIYLQERNQAAGAILPARLFISEGKLIHSVSERSGRGFSTAEHVAYGPVSFISTTTKNQIQSDDESRHISIHCNSGTEQTKRILDRYASEKRQLGKGELRAWRQVQRLVGDRADVPVSLPPWFPRVAQNTYANDVKVRRYFPAFIEACKVVALLRSFQRFESVPTRVEVDFADFAITTQIFEGVFTESLHSSSDLTLETRKNIEILSNESGGAPVDSKALAQRLGISKDRAYNLLRRAAATAVIRRANPPAKTNRKFFLPVPLPRFIPDPQIILDCSPEIESPVEFVDPFTGEKIIFRRRKRAAD